MRKIIALGALSAALLLLGAAGAAPAERSSFKALFCPECWEYLYGPGAVDMKGNCAACGKYPVEMETQAMAWWWCGREKKWRREACPVNWMKRCCAREESLAAVVSPGPNVFEAWYCPSHRGFDAFRIPILSQFVCKTCAKPLVKVDATERAWYWCATDGVWSPRPCPMNALKKCCSKRDGMLLVKQEPGPIAK